MRREDDHRGRPQGGGAESGGLAFVSLLGGGGSLTPRLPSTLLAAALAVLAAACAAPPPSGALSFPAEAESFRRPANLKQTMLFRPAAGTGPFPAVKLLPTCGGMQPHVVDWAERLTREGYVTLLVESNTPRGVPTNCVRPPPVRYDEQMADAIAALGHLRTMPLVQRERIAVVGFSFGAGVALRMASTRYQQQMVAEAASLRAVASFYPWCNTSGSEFHSRGMRTEGLPSDIATPTMIFTGADDDETLASWCTERVDRLQTVGRPISYKLYSGTTHAYDSRENGIHGRRVPRGFFYRYSPGATEESWQELRAFLRRHLAP